MVSFRLAAIQVLQESQKPLHYNEITELAIERNLITTSGDTPKATMNAQIAIDIKYKKEKSAFVRVGRGIFTLNSEYTDVKIKQEEKQEDIEYEIRETETKSTQHIGTAGEHLVISELLFKGFNANRMSVDKGIDIVAIKDDRLYNIQVKTSNEKNGLYVSDINVNSYQKHNFTNTFYIFVLRDKEKKTNFLILPYTDIKKNIDQKNMKVINHGKRYRANIRLRNNRFYLGKDNDLTYYNNNWDLIN